MPNKFELRDHEAVTRSRKSRVFGSQESEDESQRVRPVKNFRVAVDLADDRNCADSLVSAQGTPSEEKNRQLGPTPAASLFRRGHALSYFGVFLFTFMVFFRPYELIPSLSWASSSAFVIAIITLAIYVPTQLGLEGRLTIRPREVNFALLLLVACLLSMPLALSPATAWKSFGDFLKVIVIFIVMVNVIRTEKRLKKLLLLVLAASCVVSMSALNDYRLGRLDLQGRRIEGVIGGLFGNPNDLAVHLVTMIPISVGLMLGSKGGMRKALYLGGALLMVAGTVATFSRGGFIGLLGVAGTMFWIIARKNRVIVVALLAVLAVGFLAIAPSDYRSRMSTTGDGSSVARRDDLKRSIYLTLRHPLLGVGLGNYVLYSNSSKATHNAYTQVGSELGVAAMVVYILFLVTPLRKLQAIRKEAPIGRRRSPLQWLALGMEASLVGYMVVSFFASVALQWYAYYLVTYALCLHRLIEAGGVAGTVQERGENALPLGNSLISSASTSGNSNWNKPQTGGRFASAKY